MEGQQQQLVQHPEYSSSCLSIKPGTPHAKAALIWYLESIAPMRVLDTLKANHPCRLLQSISAAHITALHSSGCSFSAACLTCEQHQAVVYG